MKLERSSALGRLGELGQSVWIDYLSRDLLESGELARLVQHDAVVGVTSNPSIFEQALAYGDAYDEQLRELFPSERSAKDVFLELACRDVADACDVLRPVWDEAGGADGFVSLEVEPAVAHDTDLTIEQAIGDGININVTLLFSVAAYEKVAKAYQAGIQKRKDAG